MSRLWEIVTRTPPRVAPAALIRQGGISFGFAAEAELTGWTVMAYGADGRRLGRPLKGLSEAALATLTRQVAAAEDRDLQQFAAVWIDVCKRGSTNADVLTGFADAAEAVVRPAQ